MLNKGRLIFLDILIKTKYIRPISPDRGRIYGSAGQEIRSRGGEAIRHSRQGPVSADHQVSTGNLRRSLMTDNQAPEEGFNHLLQVKDEIIEVLNQLKGIADQLQKGKEVSYETVNALIARGETLARTIGALPDMEQAGEEFMVHIHKIGQAIRDLQNFDALKKENLIAGVKF
jgi:hypothetical protein